MFFFKTQDLAVLLSCVILGFFIIQSWNLYESCYAPIQVFIMETIVLIFVHRLLDAIRKKSFIPLHIKRLLTIFVNVGLNATFIYVTVQGFIWQSMNASREQNCAVLDKTSWAIWLLLSGLVLMDAVILFYAISYIIVWKKFRDFRRRQANMTDAQIIGEYMNGRITQVFLSGNLADDNGERPALTFEEIQRIPRKIHGECGDNALTFGDNCPVCYEDFKNGEEVCALPGCSHVYHWKCIHGWFTMSPLCPMCRSNVKYSLGDAPTSLSMTHIVSNTSSFDIENQAEGRA